MPLITVQHQARARARAQAKQITKKPAAEMAASVPENSDRAVIEAALEADLHLLSERTDVAEKIALKRQLLPKYLPHVQAYRESGAHYPNPLLVYCLIWLLDVEDIEPALELAEFAIAQQQQLPARFKRDLPTWVVETVHDWAERQYKAQQSATPYLEQVVEAVQAERWIVTQPIVLNKLYKLAGLYAERNGDIDAAVHWYQLCEQVNPGKSGVKTRLQKLQGS
ncbi:phage terminase small subunit [Microbulbifer thermotolerans]|uniref:phage terminase small subunit n=1 Tax=Microbulbifer thermotolerans TaxID=252514 RepID=UPI00224A4A57|nr:phage terminase small subunit [Microbulbifer thermotolerans]MCX2834466.1 phage terminase small subunit [Microbulbifer thermotolerans]